MDFSKSLAGALELELSPNFTLVKLNAEDGFVCPAEPNTGAALAPPNMNVLDVVVVAVGAAVPKTGVAPPKAGFEAVVVVADALPNTAVLAPKMGLAVTAEVVTGALNTGVAPPNTGLVAEAVVDGANGVIPGKTAVELPNTGLDVPDVAGVTLLNTGLLDEAVVAAAPKTGAEAAEPPPI